MDNPNKKLWFRARHYGWGWTPITWEGWTSLGVAAAIIVVGGLTMKNGKDFLALVIAVILGITLLGYRKGEQPHWSWGDPQKNLNDQDNHHD